MNSNQGVIKRTPFKVIEVRNQKTKFYKFKIKNVCEPCNELIQVLAMNGELEPVEHAGACSNCQFLSLRQPYQVLCTICCRILNKCVMCCSINIFETGETVRIMRTLVAPPQKAIMHTMSDQKRRSFLRRIFKVWKKHEKNKMSLEEAREDVTEFQRLLIEDVWEDFE